MLAPALAIEPPPGQAGPGGGADRDRPAGPGRSNGAGVASLSKSALIAGFMDCADPNAEGFERGHGFEHASIHVHVLSKIVRPWSLE